MSKVKTVWNIEEDIIAKLTKKFGAGIVEKCIHELPKSRRRYQIEYLDRIVLANRIVRDFLDDMGDRKGQKELEIVRAFLLDELTKKERKKVAKLKKFCKKHRGEEIRVTIDIKPGEEAIGDGRYAESYKNNRGWVYIDEPEGRLKVGGSGGQIFFHYSEISSVTCAIPSSTDLSIDCSCKKKKTTTDM